MCRAAAKNWSAWSSTHTALLSLEDEELPQQDRVRFGQSVRAALVAGASGIRVRRWVSRRRQLLAGGDFRARAMRGRSRAGGTPPVDTAQIEQRIEQEVDARLGDAVAKAVSERRPAQDQTIAQAVATAEKRFESRSAGRSGDAQQTAAYYRDQKMSLMATKVPPVNDAQGRPMKTPLIASLMLCALPAGSMADKPKVIRAMLERWRRAWMPKLLALWPLAIRRKWSASTQGAYINGYGAVFMSEMNLAPAAGISPFHPTIKPEEIKRTHDKKVQRIAAQLRSAMRKMLVGFGRIARLGSGRRADRAGRLAVLLELGESRGAAGSDRDARTQEAAAAGQGRRRPTKPPSSSDEF